MTRLLVMVAVLLSLAATAALARHHTWVGGAGTGPFGTNIAKGQGGSGGGSSCSGALDLSQGCIIPGMGP